MKQVAAVCLLSVTLGCGDGGQVQPQTVDALRARAEQGRSADAQFNLGNMYSNGEGVPQDDAEAVRWYRLAADQGYAAAQVNLGIRYREGRGVPQDDVEAIRWYRLAAKQGYGVAQVSLGFMYREGQGVPQDYVEAIRWYRLAAEQGYADAQVNLGFMYRGGRGVPQDYVQAHLWYNLAASRLTGEARETAVRNRDKVAGQMLPHEIADAQRRAREWDAAHPQ